MPLFRFDDIVRHTSGEVAVDFQRDSQIETVVIDSRETRRGSLFVPLKGSRTDGHEYLAEALDNGAEVCMIRRSCWQKYRRSIGTMAMERKAGLVLVEDPLRAMQKLARHYVQGFPNLIRIGITGSNGKTTTKEIAGRVLSQVDRTIINEGNMNSDIGLPLSCFRVQEKDRFAVFEMGMNRPGEMDELADIVNPDFALITNVGIAHIEFIGSKNDIAKEKKRIFKHFSCDNSGFLYEDEPYYDFLCEGIVGSVRPYGPKTTQGYGGNENLGLDGTIIHWEGLQVHFPLFGIHNLVNALGAVSLAAALGADRTAVKKGLEGVEPLFGRSQIIRNSITVIQDCYNANPESMRTVLEFFSRLSWKGRKIAVLGSMLELGERSGDAHAEIGRLASELDVDLLCLFGSEMEQAYEALRTSGFSGRCFWTVDFSTLLEKTRRNVRAGDVVLIKGSRGVSLENLVEPLFSDVA